MTCTCGHSQEEHHSSPQTTLRAGGVFPCKHWGCGCGDYDTDPWPGLMQQAYMTLIQHGREELSKHAQVSIQNRHRCKSCFCCACWAVLRANPR